MWVVRTTTDRSGTPSEWPGAREAEQRVSAGSDVKSALPARESRCRSLIKPAHSAAVVLRPVAGGVGWWLSVPVCGIRQWLSIRAPGIRIRTGVAGRTVGRPP